MFPESSQGQLPKKGHFPTDIPAKPSRTYENRGWVGMGDWLGTGTVAPFLRQYRPFKKAQTFVHRLGLGSVAEWRKYSKGQMPEKGRRPDDIPANPNTFYKDRGWLSWGNWLGMLKI